MTHGEFIEKFNFWYPYFVEKTAGKTSKEIGERICKSALTVGCMIGFVKRNQSVPRCEWLKDFSQDSVKRIAALVPLTSLEEMRKNLIERFRIDPSGPYKPYPKAINTGTLKRIMAHSGLKWYERNGKPCVHWTEKA